MNYVNRIWNFALIVPYPRKPQVEFRNWFRGFKYYIQCSDCQDYEKKIYRKGFAQMKIIFKEKIREKGGYPTQEEFTTQSKEKTAGTRI